MATTVMHECDKCGKTLRMDSSGSLNAWAKWMKADAQLATDEVKDKGVFKLLWCGECFKKLIQRLPKVMDGGWAGPP